LPSFDWFWFVRLISSDLYYWMDKHNQIVMLVFGVFFLLPLYFFFGDFVGNLVYWFFSFLYTFFGQLFFSL
jgi:hypothetical protein